MKPGREPTRGWERDSVAPKAQGAAGRRDGSPLATGTRPHTAEPAVSAAIKADLASVAAAQAQDEDEDDAFSDVPTEANRANPMVAPHAIDAEAGQGLAGVGAYRMVRPATSDRVEVPAAPERPAAKPKANRVIIGVARKS
jgi:hypothetical protein